MLQVNDGIQGGKVELLRITGELMPGGRPDYKSLIKYPKVTDLVSYYGEPSMLLLLSVMVRDFCGSLNLRYNMNEDQIIEAAFMLIQEAGNFRVEDYLMFFAMAKKRELGKIYETMDISVISGMLDIYFTRRSEAGRREAEEEANHINGLGPSIRDSEGVHPQDVKVLQFADRLTGVFGHIKQNLKESLNETGKLDGGAIQGAQ